MKRSLGSDVPKLQSESINQYETTDQKAERNRERNREHAKKTRLRKKEMIESMKIRLLELQRESVRLEQLVEESNTANILLCLGGKSDASSTASSSTHSSPKFATFPSSSSSLTSDARKESDEIGLSLALSKGNIIDQLKQKVRSEAVLSINKDSYLGPDLTISEMEGGGEEEDEEDESLDAAPHSKGGEIDSDLQNRRARNRMHAKLTRDRKKLFTAKMQETIQMLERHNEQLKLQLQQVNKPSAIQVSPLLPFSYPAMPMPLPVSTDPLSAFCYYAELLNRTSNEAPQLLPTTAASHSKNQPVKSH